MIPIKKDMWGNVYTDDTNALLTKVTQKDKMKVILQMIVSGFIAWALIAANVVLSNNALFFHFRVSYWGFVNYMPIILPFVVSLVLFKVDKHMTIYLIHIIALIVIFAFSSTDIHSYWGVSSRDENAAYAIKIIIYMNIVGIVLGTGLSYLLNYINRMIALNNRNTYKSNLLNRNK